MLCPSFNISKINSTTYGCQANFTSSSCNRTTHLTLEAWTKDSVLIQSFGTVFVNCSASNVTKTSPGLAEAVFSILESVAPVLNGPWAPNCTWSSWTTWSKCSKTCGDFPGLQKRIRRKCEKVQSETQECQVNKCPKNCIWGSWNEWSSCSQSCGTGQRSRTREINQTEAYEGIFF